MRLDWTEILRKAGVPEPPGRAEALIKPQRWWLATMRRKRTTATITETLEAPSYHVALAECRQRFKDCSLIRLVECKRF